MTIRQGAVAVEVGGVTPRREQRSAGSFVVCLSLQGEVLERRTYWSGGSREASCCAVAVQLVGRCVAKEKHVGQSSLLVGHWRACVQ